MREISVGMNEAGQRLDKLMFKYLREAPPSFVYRMLRKKNITLNRKKAQGSEKLAVGDTIQLFLADDTVEKFSAGADKLEKNKILPAKYAPRLVFEDENIIIFCKPKGLLSQKADKNDISVNEYLIDHLLKEKEIDENTLKSFTPAVVNRLDRNTSGLIAAGKTLPALQELSRVFADRTVRKYYICIVKGQICAPGQISTYLYKDEDGNLVRMSEKDISGAKKAQTRYWPLWTDGRYSLLLVHLITGRTHQIRAHFAGVGHPIAGDKKYGDEVSNREMAEKYGVRSQMLHSCFMRFPDDLTGLKGLNGRYFYADPPIEFFRVCAGLADILCGGQRILETDEAEKNGDMEDQGAARIHTGGHDKPVQ